MVVQPPVAINRRVFYRLSVELPTRYRVEGLGTDAEQGGSTINLSCGGLLMRCRLPAEDVLRALLAGEARLRVTIELPDAPLVAHTQAIWAERDSDESEVGRVGMRFVALDAGAQARLEAALSRLSE